MKVLRIWVLVIGTFISGQAGAQNIRSVKITELEQIIKESRTPLILNMWSTWCQPCIEEIPYFISEVNKQNALARKAEDSIRLVLVSLDFKETYPKKLSQFVRQRKFNAEVVWLDETNADVFCPKIDPKWSGAIPATLFINHKTGYRNFYEEQLSPEDLKKEIMAILKSL